MIADLLHVCEKQTSHHRFTHFSFMIDIKQRGLTLPVDGMMMMMVTQKKMLSTNPDTMSGVSSRQRRNALRTALRQQHALHAGLTLDLFPSFTGVIKNLLSEF